MGLGPGSRGQKCSRFFVPQGTENVNWGHGGAQLERPKEQCSVQGWKPALQQGTFMLALQQCGGTRAE